MLENKQVTIKLETWQKRMLADYLPSQKVKLPPDLKRIDKISVWPGKGGCLKSYRVINKITDGFEIYLTDSQIELVRKELGAAEVVSITVSAEALQNQGVVLT